MITELRRRRSVPSPLARLGLGACLLAVGVLVAIVIVGLWVVAFTVRPR